jgi:membrane protein YqaA with SNARE-associated domain
MEALTLFAICFISGVVWVFSAEATAVVYVTELRWNPLATGLVCATGQGTMHVLLFLGADGLRQRWRRFDRLCRRVQDRHGARLRSSAGLVAVSSGLLGVPPVSIVAALAPGMGLRASPLLPGLFVLRTIRFTVVAAFGQQLMPWIASLFR